MTSNSSHSDGTGCTPTSPSSTSPALSPRSTPTQFTSIHMSDSESGTRDSDTCNSGSRPSREHKAISRYIAGLSNQPTTLTQPTAASVARTNARKSSQVLPQNVMSPLIAGQPATHSIRNRSRRSSGSVPSPIPPTTSQIPSQSLLPSRVRMTFAKEQEAVTSSP